MDGCFMGKLLQLDVSSEGHGRFELSLCHYVVPLDNGVVLINKEADLRMGAYLERQT